MEEGVDATEKSVTRNRDDAIRVPYETGAHSYQQIAKEFESIHHSETDRAPGNEVREHSGKDSRWSACAMIVDLTLICAADLCA